MHFFFQCVGLTQGHRGLTEVARHKSPDAALLFFQNSIMYIEKEDLG